MLVVLTTTPTREEAKDLALKIVQAKLAACVQIVPNMMSVYEWEGEVKTTTEQLLLIKTLSEKWDALSSFIAANHSYDVPEIVALNTEHVSSSYLDWINGLLA